MTAVSFRSNLMLVWQVTFEFGSSDFKRSDERVWLVGPIVGLALPKYLRIVGVGSHLVASKHSAHLALTVATFFSHPPFPVQAFSNPVVAVLISLWSWWDVLAARWQSL